MYQSYDIFLQVKSPVVIDSLNLSTIIDLRPFQIMFLYS